jgi:hypothetical protein
MNTKNLEEFKPILMYTLKIRERDAWRPERYEIIYGIHDRKNGRYMGSTMESFSQSCLEHYGLNTTQAFHKLTEAVTDFIDNRLEPNDSQYGYFLNKLEEWYRDRVRQYFRIMEESGITSDTQVPAYEIDYGEEMELQERFNLWIRGYKDKEIAEETEEDMEVIRKWREKMRLNPNN